MDILHISLELLGYIGGSLYCLPDCSGFNTSECISPPPCTDQDGDGYGDPASPLCSYPELDCNDNNETIYPGAPEICEDGIDQNCDGLDLNCTCQNQGYYCCESCQSGPHPEYDSDCSPLVCCEVCTGQYFLPEQLIEAEDGELTSPMQTAANSTASGGYYVYTSTNNQGSVNFTFDIQQAGKYRMEARILTPPPDMAATNSFYVGLDNEPAQGDNNYTYDTLQTSVFAWDNVSLRGPNGNVSWAEFDPMVWDLSQGLHNFTFYGREPNTWLDQIILKRLFHRADKNKDGCIVMDELMDFIDLWKQDSTTYPMWEVMQAIGLWKAGVGC